MTELNYKCFPISYKKNELYIDGYSCSKLAKIYGTPLYCYSISSVENSFRILKKSFDKLSPLICYAVKANFNSLLIRQLSRLGSGTDVVSIGELKQSLKNGIKPENIVFSGVGKTSQEIIFAIKKKIRFINIESEEELDEINKIASKENKTVNILVRINPNVDAGTHEKISTGRIEDKFGVSKKRVIEIFEKFRSSPFVNIKGLSIHIGSQIQSLAPFKKAFEEVRELINELRSLQFEIKTIDIGGGIGIDYGKNKTLSIEKYAKLVEKIFLDLGVEIILEPGRLLVGNSGIIISKVIRIKKGEGKNFLIIDCGMNNILRPSLYNAFHDIKPVISNSQISKANFDIVGPICESSDIFLKNYKIQRNICRDDLVVICSTGAYGFCMASNYNLREEAKEIFVKNGKLLKL